MCCNSKQKMTNAVAIAANASCPSPAAAPSAAEAKIAAAVVTPFTTQGLGKVDLSVM